MTGFLDFARRNARWLGGAFLLCFGSSFGQTFFISLSGGEIRRELALSNGAFGFIYMVATLGSAATLPFAGRLLDRFSTRQVAAVVILGLALACLLMASVQNVAMLVIAIYLLRFFGQGMMSQIAFTAVGRWFIANRGRAVSIATIGNQAGEAIFPLSFVTLATWLGWRGNWIASAAILALVALPAITTLVRLERDPSSGQRTALRPAARDWTIGEVLRSWAFYVLCLGVLAPPFIATSIFFHQVFLTEERGWPLELFASSFIVMSAVTAGFALVCGWMIDRFTALRILPFFLVPMTLACLVIANATEIGFVFLFMALLGISNGFSATLFGALWPEVYGTKHLGQLRSVVLAAIVFGSALGPGLTGVLIDRGVPLSSQINAMALYCLVATILMTFVSLRLRGSAHLRPLDPPLPEPIVDRIDPDPEMSRPRA
ncbi:MFS transporter [Aureimonas jatrophae]|uniref:Sugar phosphate permease n=1 Tax=Aureimonas jatrophae TaxID=1166073 RepID=A0A1H0GHD4_9HYPH|nr:MFS transporter [Aureimonas jatrophae]MBB3949573.1 MFS family permease [Aureimonas jatrophae]SDO06337.1 Sugar phosphate permease [Aureimonas jatrophae]